MSKKQFKAESKRLLDLMINSIYTHKEIFLREIISQRLGRHRQAGLPRAHRRGRGHEPRRLRILIAADKDAGTLTVSDNGIGMTQEEREQTSASSRRAAPWPLRPSTARTARPATRI